MSRTVRQADQPMTLGNWAESLLELGRRIRRQVRQGTGIADLSQEFQVARDYCQLAVEFVSSSDLLKLRALVEDWPLERITQQLRGPASSISEGTPLTILRRSCHLSGPGVD